MTKCRYHPTAGKRVEMKRNFNTYCSFTEDVSMAICCNYIQRVKTVINDYIIEQVTGFRYLEYRISEYKSNLENKL